MRRSSVLAAAFAALALAPPAGAAEPPARVVSMNLCTDQLALMLAGPGQLLSVSNLATDPFSSPMVEEARGIPQNRGRAEEIFLMEPDLVLASTWSDPVAIGMLRRLGMRVVQVAPVEALAEVAPRVAEVGALLGREAEAARVIARFEDDLAALAAPAEGPRAAFYYPNGYTLGTGTLSHDILTTAGFRHLSEELGRGLSGRLALELMVIAAPDLVIGSAPYPGASRSEEILRHPALRALVAAGAGHESGPEWVCGTPHVTRALRGLAEVRATFEAGR